MNFLKKKVLDYRNEQIVGERIVLVTTITNRL
jgi:hypothetical protein